ncbi:MAG: rRNA pseudouridine synthase [Oscillospiraceae bacterium]|nr:rRNA pseudouridine synthase [Oscillospiraceae bacterium]
MKERIQKILSSRGVASRRHAEDLIKQGRVCCNGVVCNLGDTADPDTDKITLDGVLIPGQTEKVYLMLHKPRGYVTTMSDEKGRKNVSELVADCGVRVYPVGRLDMDSEGLLIFTNDGDFANRMMHPRNEVNKTYLTTVTGFTEEGLLRFEEPMELDGYQLSRPSVDCLRKLNAGKAVLRITIHEGRNRQVRRMCEIAGMRVTRLTRISEGSLQLGDLPSGKWRYLTKKEIAQVNE